MHNVTYSLTRAQLDVTLSAAAAEYIRDYLTRCSAIKPVLKLHASTAGCSGLMFAFSCIDQQDCLVHERVMIEGFEFAFADEVLPFMYRLTIDYQGNDLTGRKMVFASPYLHSQCGCGDSYTFDAEKYTAAMAEICV